MYLYCFGLYKKVLLTLQLLKFIEIFMKLLILKSVKNGFTLLEVLITMAILAIIAGFASNGYNNFIKNKNRDAAALILQKDAQFMAHWYAKYGSYVDSKGNYPSLPYTSAPESNPLYAIRLSNNSVTDPNSFHVLALPYRGNSQAGMGCICVDPDGNVNLKTNSSCNNATSKVTDCYAN